MPDQPSLVALLCPTCGADIAATDGEFAWSCRHCEAGVRLDEQLGSVLLDIGYDAGVAPGSTGAPYWVVTGRVTVTRKTFGFFDANAESGRQWRDPVQFFIPATLAGLDTIADRGPALLLSPPPFSPGPIRPFSAVTTPPADLPALAEFIVMGVETGRSDKLSDLEVSVALDAPVLRVLAS